MCIYILLLNVFLLYPSHLSLATGVDKKNKVMEEDASVFSDANISLVDDNFVIPILTTYSVSRATEVVSAELTEEELLNIRFTTPLAERQSMCAVEIVNGMRDYENAEGVNVLKYALTSDEIKEVYATIRNSYPEFFYIANRYGYYCYAVDSTTYPDWDCDKLVEELFPYYTWYNEVRYEPDVEAINKAWDEVDYAIEQYKNILRLDEQNDIGKFLTIHDYMIGLCNYDDEAYESYSKNGTVLEEYVHSYDIYGILVNQKGVCSGYQLAYRYILEQSGFLDVTYVLQDNHIWNAVKYGDNWYHVDLTYDDTTPYGSSFHKSFLKSDVSFQSSHGEYETSVTCTDPAYDSYYWDDITSNFYYVGDNTYLYSDSDAGFGSCVVDASGDYSDDYTIYTTTDVLKEGVENTDIDTHYYFKIGDFEFREKQGDVGFVQVYQDKETVLADFWDLVSQEEGYNTILSACSGLTIYDGKVYVSSTQSQMSDYTKVNEWWKYEYDTVNHIYTIDDMFVVPSDEDNSSEDTGEFTTETTETTENENSDATTEQNKTEIPTIPSTEASIEGSTTEQATTSPVESTENLENQDSTPVTTEEIDSKKGASSLTYNKKIQKPTIQSVKSVNNNKKITVRMKKVGKKYKYQCQISKSKKFKKIYKSKTFYKASYTFKNMKKGKYYIRVRLLKGNKYGKWSKVRMVRVK